MSDPEPLLIYITSADQTEAEKLARMALEAKFVACANILAPVTSIYWWEDKLETDTEVAVIMKSRDRTP